MPSPFTVAVTGATGTQGGSALSALLRGGHRVVALTRDPTSSRARALADRGVELRRADLTDPESLASGLAGADSLFAVTTPFETDTDTEVAQGRNLIDSAAEAGVGHVVFTSAANADRGTGIPHFESKHLIEQHLAESGLEWTVIGPAKFMDDYQMSWTLDMLRSGRVGLPMPPETPLAHVAAADIGAFAALAIGRRSEFSGRRVDIASDMLSGKEIAAVLAERCGGPVEYVEFPMDQARQWSADLAAMFAYFSEVGLDINTADLHRRYPEVGWHTFAGWTTTKTWPTA
ncbi:NmrA/HSCARG family protein [Promicromonospora sp. NPDC057138]|uniref:NmrA/HSCARG family protein n=1 Tax=Promicromonospora sp. NPDC057138 TaxID=3346031 RepID=UPI0036337408